MRRQAPPRVRYAIAIAVLGVVLISGSRGAAETGKDLRGMVLSMAQHFVQEQFMIGDRGHYHIEFDLAYLHPQAQPNYWAVVGGFVSDQNTPNTYVAAVRLICPDFDAVVCWRLEKLAINDEIVLDRGDPL